MARSGITSEQVTGAAQTLSNEGIKPTVAAVRERLGSGSYSTITKHLSAWRDSQQPVSEPVVEMPDSVTSAMGKLWITACGEAQAQVKAEREALASSTIEHEAETAELRAEIEHLEGETASMADDIKQVEAERDASIDALNSRLVITARLEERLIAADQLNIQLKEEVEVLHSLIKGGADHSEKEST